MTDSDLLLRTEGVTKHFGGLTAVDHMDYTLPRGQLYCLIGPNGAGKSTFFSLLTGQIEPDQGRIFFNGEDVTGLEPYQFARRGISIKFQDINVYEDLSVEENIQIPLQRKHMSNENERVNELLDLIKLNDRRTDIVADLSHGNQQWLEIAMSMAIDPTLLLLDEPTAGMTIEETKETAKLIQSLVDRGVTAIVVEHDINFVRQIANQVTVMSDGSKFAEGSVEEIEANEDVQRIYLGQPTEAEQ